MLRLLLRIVLVLAALKGLGEILTRRLSHGHDVDANEFSIATAFGGVDRESRAATLRRGEVLAICGGAQLDLREAALDPSGAELRLRACLGGIQVVVPDTWLVTVEPTVIGGGVELSVAAKEDLPHDAPSLRVEATAMLGGIQVTTVVDNDEADESGMDAGG